MRDERKSKAELIKELRSLRRQLKKGDSDANLLKQIRHEFSILSFISTDALFLYENGICIEQNEMAKQILGYFHHEVQGKPGTAWIFSDGTELYEKNALKSELDYIKTSALKKNGHFFSCEFMVKKLPCDKKLYQVLVLHDLTPRIKEEDELRAIEKKYRTIADFTFDWEYWINPAEDYIYISPSVERITGYSINEFYKDKHFLEKIIYPEDLKFYQNHQHEIIDGNKIKPIEFRIVTKNGSIHWINHVCQFVYKEDGTCLGVRGSNREITEQKLSELLLHAEKEKLRTYIELAAVIFVALDTEGHVTLINKKGCEVLEYPKEEIIGKNWFENFIPEKYRRNVMPVSRKLLTGEIEPAEYFENPVLTGSHNEKLIAWHNTVLKNTAGEIIGHLSSGEDISEKRKIVNDLKNSESRLRAIVENMPVMLDAFDENGNIIVWNRECEKVTGYKAKEIINNPKAVTLFYPEVDYRNYIIEQLAKFGGNFRNIEWDIHCKDGTKKTILWSNLSDKYPISGWHSWAIGINITERKNAQKALQANEKKLQYLYDFAPNMLVSVSADSATIVDCNLTLLNELGYTRKEIQGKPVFNLYNAKSAKYATEVLFPRFKDTGFIEDEEMQIQRKDGSLIHVILNVKPIYDEKGKLVRSHSSFIDITERKKFEEQLKDSESRYRKLFEDSPVSLWEEDFSEVEKYFQQLRKKGISDYRNYFMENKDEVLRCVNKIKVLDINKAAIKLHQAKNKRHLLSSLQEVFDKKSVDVFIEEFVALAEGSETFEQSLKFITLKGEVRYGLLKLFVGKTKQGKRNFSQIIFAINDITALKLAEDERFQLEKQILHTQKLESMGVLAGGIAHDFNNLLTSIVGNADLAIRKLPISSHARRNIREVIHASHRASDLANQMLAYSGKGQFQIEKVNLNDLVQEMSQILKVSISKKVVLKYNFTSDIPLIEADKTQLHQVIMNLITNASEAIGDKVGVITVETGVLHCTPTFLGSCIISDNNTEGKYVYVMVMDSGCGMDKETMAKIFDPFFTKKFTGRGLGMAAVLGIVRGHKGNIKVESELNKGTSVHVFIPGIATNSETLNKTGRMEPEIPMEFTGTILLVDDEEKVRETCAEMLESIGFDVLRAIDGIDALEILSKSEKPISCIILDLTMPSMDGEQMVRELKNRKMNIPVIVSSGYSEQEIAGKFDDSFVKGFIQKPFMIRDLVYKLNKALR